MRNFSQADFFEDDVMILDAFNEIYVWFGSGSNDIERRRSMKVCMWVVMCECVCACYCLICVLYFAKYMLGHRVLCIFAVFLCMCHVFLMTSSPGGLPVRTHRERQPPPRLPRGPRHRRSGAARVHRPLCLMVSPHSFVLISLGQ